MTITFATIIITELDGYQRNPDNLNFIVRPRFKRRNIYWYHDKAVGSGQEQIKGVHEFTTHIYFSN